MPGYEGYTEATTLSDDDLLLVLDDPAGSKATKRITAANARKGFSTRVNLKDAPYNAKGDGTTDDTAAVQAWLTDIATNGRAGWVPNGVYRLTSKINVPKLPGWTIQGETKVGAVFRQDTVTAAHFDMGAIAGSALHSFTIENLTFTRPAGVTAANTAAICLLFSVEVYFATFRNLRFVNSYSGMTVSSGIGCPWGSSFYDLEWGGGMVGNAMNWVNGINAVPNNFLNRLSIDTSNYTVGPILDMRGYNCTIGTIEFFGNLQGITGLRWNSVGQVTLGAVKFEGITNTGAGFRFLDFLGACKADIGQIFAGGGVSTLTPSSGVTSLVSSGTGGYVRVGHVVVEAVSLSGQVVIVGGSTGSRTEIGHVQMAGGWTLQSTGSTTSSDAASVGAWNNGQLSADKGDANYTVTVGDPNVAIFQTPFTAQRTITLPSKSGNNLFTGLKYEFVFNGAINGANNVVIKEGANTLDTFKADKIRVVYTYRRNLWVLTAYGVLGPEGRTTFSNADYTALSTDRILAQTGTLSAARVVTLPAASAVPGGTVLQIIDESGTATTTNTLSWARAGSDTINGGTGNVVAVNSPYGSRSVISDGTSKWTIVPTGEVVGRRFVSGSYYPPMMTGSDTTVAPGQNFEQAVRFDVGATTTFTRIGLEVTTAAASNVFRLGIRNDNGNGYPGALVLDAGTIDASTTGFKEITISQILTPGRYWVSATLQGGTGAAYRHRFLDSFVGQQNGTDTNMAGYYSGGTTGALGTFTASVNANGVGPKILLKAA